MRLLLSVAAAAALVAAAALPGPAAARRDLPNAGEIVRYVDFPDRVLRKAASRATIPPTTAFSETIPTGETLDIRLSKTVFGSGGDPTAARSWADFFGGLVHGPELALLSIYILNSDEIEGVCGSDALACYGNDVLFTPAQDPSSNLSAEAVAMHEYGHHVAEHRESDPWSAIDWGPKRWASYEQVCANTTAGRYFPGAEDENHYEFNPGEGWAETYRVLNERHFGLVEAPWQIVSSAFYPDAAALSAAQLDVTSPWNGPRTSTLKGTLRRSARVRTFVVSTPLDGQLRLSLRAAKGERVSFDVLSSSSQRIVHRVGRSASASTTICGERSVRLRVTRRSGSGAFRIGVSRP